jgi:hypothetical protein
MVSIAKPARNSALGPRLESDKRSNHHEETYPIPVILQAMEGP